MQDLKELVLLLGAIPPKHLIGIAQSKEKGNKLAEFFQGLIAGKIQSDADAWWQLYQSKQETSSYRKLKSSLREQLLENLCHLDSTGTEFSNYQKEYYDCHKQWAIVKILIGQNAHINAISLASKLLKRTIKFDFVQLSMDITAYLRIQYALRESNDKKFQETTKLFAFYKEMYEAECLVEEVYTLLVVKYINTRAPKDNLGEEMQQQYLQIAPLLQKYDSYRLHLNGRLIKLMQHTWAYDFNSALADCDDALTFFEAKSYAPRGALQIFHYEKLVCHIQLGQFEAARAQAARGQLYLKPGTFNWFKWQELNIKIALNSADYQEVSDLILNAINHPKYQFLPENVKEIWRIQEAYLYFLSFLNPLAQPKNYRFKSSKFFNETPIFSKDKAGMNIAIKIIRALILIAERKYSLFLEEAESLEQYSYRYLKDSKNQRSFHFMKMLLQIPVGQFDPPVIEKRAQKHFDKLAQIPQNLASRQDEVEIVAYEHLWLMALNLLAR